MHDGYDHEEGGDSMNWSAFLAGAFLGAGVALLCAPNRGTELRSKLRDYADRATDELMEQGQEMWNTAVERGKEYYDKGEEVVRAAGRSAKDVAKQGREAVKEAGQSAKEEFTKQRQKMANEAGH